MAARSLLRTCDCNNNTHLRAPVSACASVCGFVFLQCVVLLRHPTACHVCACVPAYCQRLRASLQGSSRWPPTRPPAACLLRTGAAPSFCSAQGGVPTRINKHQRHTAIVVALGPIGGTCIANGTCTRQCCVTRVLPHAHVCVVRASCHDVALKRAVRLCAPPAAGRQTHTRHAAGMQILLHVCLAFGHAA
jgi:hypothetical protein